MRLAPCLAVGWLALGALSAQEPRTTPTHPAGAEHCTVEVEPPTVQPEPPPAGGPVPEPSTLFMVGTGLVGVALTARRRRRPR